MKKLLAELTPIRIAILSLVIIAIFLRYYLYINSYQQIKEFKNQNYKELYSMDSLAISSKLNSLSNAINWVCLEAQISESSFYKLKRGDCETGFFQQHQQISIPQANNTLISFTIRLPAEVELFFIYFFIFQTILIIALINSTKVQLNEKHLIQTKINKISRQLSHDIRSPLAALNTIVNSIDNIQDNDKKIILSSIARINNISSNFLSSNQINHSMVLSLPIMENVNINHALFEIVDEKIIEYSLDNSVKINLKANDIEYYCLLDLYEFKRCISNLINNSVESKKINAKISIEIITYSLNQDEVIVEIRDDGIGIPINILKKLGNKEVTTKKNGNGIGLFHTFEHFKKWDSKIEIKSEINNGTIVSINIPRSKVSTFKNILIDDDELVRLTWQSVAKKSNNDLQVFSSYEELGQILINLPYTTNFFIDSNLSNGVKGENIALKLYELGYYNLYLTTGHSPENFKNYKFIKEVLDKSPPWNMI